MGILPLKKAHFTFEEFDEENYSAEKFSEEKQGKGNVLSLTCSSEKRNLQKAKKIFLYLFGEKQYLVLRKNFLLTEQIKNTRN